jgi:hypothetical protein
MVWMGPDPIERPITKTVYGDHEAKYPETKAPVYCEIDEESIDNGALEYSGLPSFRIPIAG